MPSFETGKVIKNLRDALGMTQQELAEGITTRETLSRNERGNHAPSPYTIAFLFERLGVNPHFTGTYYLTKEWRQTHELVERLDTHLSYGRMEEARQLLSLLEANKAFIRDKVNQRYLALVQAVIKLREGNLKGSLFICLEALSKAFPNFEENLISKYLLTAIDLKLVNLLSTLYRKLGEKERGRQICKYLLENMDNRYMDKLEKGRHYPLVACNLTGILTEEKHYSEAIALCDKTIDICKDTGFLFLMPTLSLTKASCLFELGRLEESKQLIFEGYFVSSLFGRDNQKEFAEYFALKNFGIDIKSILLTK